MAIGLVALSNSTAVLAWPRRFRPTKTEILASGRKEGNLLIPGSQLGCMNGMASVCHQHDILSRQAIMYLLTLGPHKHSHDT